MKVQRILPIRQNFPGRGLRDVAAAVRETFEQAEWTKSVQPGSRIAIGVGSRGVANIDVIARATVDFWKSRGAEPFLVPVMGSHGAASAEGQADVLAHYGITEETMQAPVVSSLEVVSVGTTSEGIEVLMDRNAFESDGVILLSRVKWHTGFEGKLESGVHKMMAIGLGKLDGAKRYHTWALRLGMEPVIRSVGKLLLDTEKMLGGVAILEDAYHQTAEVHAIGAAEMVEREEELLARVKSWKAEIPFREVDLLIVDKIGKDISGSGMDTKVINRSVRAQNPWFPDKKPLVRRIFARDLTGKSYGNAIGVGLCDVISERLFEKIDYQAMWVNNLTSSSLQSCFVPLHFPSDRECMEKILTTCGQLDPEDCSIVWIRSTMELAEMWISENLLPEAQADPQIEIRGEPRELEFDAEGNLIKPEVAEPVGAPR